MASRASGAEPENHELKEGTWRRAIRQDKFALAQARTERRARGEQTRPHSQARTERRRHVAKEVSAGRAAALPRNRIGDIRAQPVAAGFTERIDALHRQAGQVLHRFTSKARKARPWCGTAEPWTFEATAANAESEHAVPCGHEPGAAREQRMRCRAFCAKPSLVSRGKHHKILW